MRTTSITRHGPSRSSPLLWLALPLVGIAGTLAALVLLGVIPWPFGKARAASHEGMVAVPVNARVIPIYAKVTRDDLLEPETAQVKVIYLPPEAVQPNFLTDLGKIIGRVTTHEKSKGYVFTEDDFFPEKTRPGLVAGVPPGKRAIALDVEKVRGVVHGLKAGDHLDLLSSVSVDTHLSLGGRGSYAGVKPVQDPEHPGKQALVKVLVHDGVVITPLPPPSTKPAKAGAHRPDQEIVIAVDPEEVAPLSEALTNKADIVCIARSGQPADPGEKSVTPGSKPVVRKPIVIEVFKGGKRSLVVFDEPAGAAPTGKEAIVGK